MGVKMKKIIIGGIMLLSGIVMDMGILLFGAIYGSQLTQWRTNLGKVWTAIFENHLLIPFLGGTIAIIVGIVILIREYFRDN